MADAEKNDKGPAPVAVRRVVDTWLDYAEQAEIIVHTTHDGFARVQMMPELFNALYDDPEELSEEKKRMVEASRERASHAAKESGAGFPIVHAHSLLGLWGALECFVEDLFVAMLETEPALLSETAFSRVRVPVSAVLSPGQERYRTILMEATRATDVDLALGVTKFERLLKMVGLDGHVPERVKTAVFQAQQVRNVWAHRGGIADARFLERCPTLGFEVGDRVDMAPDLFMRLMHGLHMYGTVVVNRYLRLTGRPNATPECPGYEGVFTEILGEGSGAAEPRA